MKKHLGCFGRATAISLGLAAFLLALGLCGGLVWLQQRQDEARTQFEPPGVLVTEPVSGTAAPFGSILFISATAFGSTPIVCAELWVDGDLKATLNSASPNGVTVFDAHFNFRMTQGAHLLFVRAVDTLGMIGQSQPVSLAGMPRADTTSPNLQIQAQTGDTLEKIAQWAGTDPATLQQLNPQLNGRELEPDMPVTVPNPAQSATTPPLPGSAPIPLPNSPPLQAIKPATLPIEVNLVSVLFDGRPPNRPDRLQAQVKDCRVRLLWNDNSTNAAGFEVWMAGLGLPPQMIVKLQSAGKMGAAWVEFPSPKPGLFSFWVQAFNVFGKQPSNIVWIAVEPKCPTTLATQLEIQALDMNVGGGRDKAYCYVSFENTPEKRVPSSEKQFISVQAGKGDIAGWADGNKKFVVPVPTDGTLDIAGECWGWAGKSLTQLGSFSQQYTADTWDGKRRALEGGGFQIGIAIQALGAIKLTDSQVTYTYNDPTIPAPYDLQVGPLLGKWNAATGSNQLSGDPQERTLTWKWDGDPQKISGFRIFVDGVPYIQPPGWIGAGPIPLTTAPNERKVTARLPAGCGRHIRWEIAAYSGEAESNRSKPAEFDLDPCPLYARVSFKKITLWAVSGGSSLTSQCDTIDYYWMIYTNHVTKKGGKWWADLYTGPKAYPMSCGTHTFKEILERWYKEPNPDVILVPLYGTEPTLEFGLRFQDASDFGGGSFGRNETLTMPREQWAKYHQSLQKIVGGAGAWQGVAGDTVIDVEGYEVH